jgi:hypothetical protein
MAPVFAAAGSDRDSLAGEEEVRADDGFVYFGFENLDDHPIHRGGGKKFFAATKVTGVTTHHGADGVFQLLHQHYLPPLVESVFSGFFHLRFIRTISFTEVNFRLHSNRQDLCFCLGYYIRLHRVHYERPCTLKPLHKCCMRLSL